MKANPTVYVVKQLHPAAVEPKGPLVVGDTKQYMDGGQTELLGKDAAESIASEASNPFQGYQYYPGVKSGTEEKVSG